MKNQRDFIILSIGLLVVAMAAFIVYQYKLIQQVAQTAVTAENKAEHSSHASRIALERTNELIEGQQANQQKVIEEWNEREPIGFKSSKNSDA